MHYALSLHRAGVLSQWDHVAGVELAGMARQPGDGLLERVCPGATPLEELLLRIVQPAGQQATLLARLSYIRDLPSRAGLCRLLQTVRGVQNAAAPSLLPDTTMEHCISLRDVSHQHCPPGQLAAQRIG